MPKLSVKSVKNVFVDKMKENYETLQEFLELSKVPLASETVRRAVYQGKEISIPAQILLMKYLGFTPLEIKKALVERGDKEYSALIGETNIILQPWEEAAVEIVRAMKKKQALADFVHSAEMVAKAHKIDVSEHLAKLRR